MNYKLKQSHRKTVSLRIVDGELRVYAPLVLSLSEIDAIVKAKSSWIEKHLKPVRRQGFFVFDEAAYLFGAWRPIVHREGEWGMDLGEALVLTYPKGSSEKKVQSFVEMQLKKRLESLIQASLVDVCKQLGRPVPEMKIRRYKRIHGRCSSEGQLAFNTYLYHEAEAFIHYIVVHECAHLIEFNHSKRFYDVVASLMPEYKEVVNAQKRSRFLDRDQ